ncbi:MAG TPA: TRAFs-binding domain-containing protein [Pyrinomonadaceae bacterium]
MSDTEQQASVGPLRCFVVMGFGIKTDYATGRQLDLNKSYRLLIKPVVEERGLVCVRADEIRHSGIIDVPMYQELLTADVVIADLSTANPNALYELGIRHALRPQTTIVISESKLPYPFDLNHVVITGYTHLGDAIDFDEVVRFRQVLGNTLDAVLQEKNTDSPVYTFLKLTPPSLGGEAAQAVARAGKALEQAGQAIADAAVEQRASEPEQTNPTLSMLIEQGERAIEASQFPMAKAMFAAALQLGQDPTCGAITQDPYLIQRFVLTTYKAEQPDKLSALNEALKLLEQLAPNDSNDPETVGLAGAIEKRLYDEGQGVEHLNRAISYYARGYFLRNDRYNGINLAYLLNIRADTSLDATNEEQIADLVWANRIRREVRALCDQNLEEIHERNQRASTQSSDAGSDEVKNDQKIRDEEQEFWCLATKAEAHFGLGEMESYERTRREAQAVKHATWMMQTFVAQIERLKGLLSKYGHLLNPPWPGVGPPEGQS